MEERLFAITFAMITYEPDGSVRSTSSGVYELFDTLEEAAEHINREFADFDENGIREDKCSSHNKLISSTEKRHGTITWTEFVEDTPIMAGVHITTHYHLVDIHSSHVHIGQ